MVRLSVGRRYPAILMECPVYSITAGHRPNKVTFDISERDEAFDMVKDAITSLMKTSIIIRQATPRDRYVKASLCTKDPFIDTFDIAHVGHKFPRLDVEGRQWLKERLGKAITQRRQYLKYTREHHSKFQYLSEDAGPFEIKAQPDVPRSIVNRPADQAASLKSLPASALAPTDASTLQTSKLQPIERVVEEIPEDPSDSYSQTSFATSYNSSEGESRLQSPTLTDVTNTFPFECPYCWTLQDIRNERKWR